MRTIKFRGYNRKNGQWIYGFYLQNRGAHFVGPDEFANGKGWEDYEVDPDTVGQFTGVVDPNGVEVYEGDVIGYTDAATKEVSTFGVVRWSSEGNFYINDHSCANYSDDEGGSNVGYMIPAHKSLTVIGNIHDNPELLEKEG